MIRIINIPLLVSLTLLVAVWHIFAIYVQNSSLLPSPSRTYDALIYIIRTTFLEDTISSLNHLFVGYSLGMFFGISIAVLSGVSRYFAALIEPISELLRPIGAIAWIPIALLLFGVGSQVAFFLIFIAAVFPIYLSTLQAVRSIDPQFIRAAESLGARKKMIITHIILPGSIPLIMTGARLSMGVSWMAMIAAELIGADEGLGWRVFWFQEFFRMDRVLALMIIIGVIGLLIDKLLRSLQSRLTPWLREFPNG